jgi:hypothetical protein
MHTWDDLGGRIDGPFAFRLIIQPMVAAILATRAGMKDAHEGRPPHGWAILTDSSTRCDLLRESCKDVAKVFAAAVIIDLIYQIIVFRWIYPVQSLIVGVILALLPYLLIRGPVNRIARFWRANAELRARAPHTIAERKGHS